MRVNFDAGTEDDETGYVPCKNCRRPMVELARYDVMNEIPGMGISEVVWYGWLESLFIAAWWWVSLRIKGWRLNRVLRRYPRTLICANCGTLWKR